MGRLTNKRRAWLMEYLRCWNATEAARRVGYKHPNTQGPRLLLDVGIQAQIQMQLEEMKMGADEVLTRLAAMARSDISEFIDDSGIIDWDKVRKQGYLVKKVRHVKDKNSEIELYDSQSALQLIGKHYGLFIDRQEITGSGGEPFEIIIGGIDPDDDI